jgi:hypothetical protein
MVRFDAVIVVQEELFYGPKAVGCFLVREPLGCLVELVGRDGGNRSVTAEEALAKQRLHAKGVVHDPDQLSVRHLPPGLVPVDDAADLATFEKEVGVLVVPMYDLGRGPRLR